MILPKYPNLELVIAGDGEYRKKLEKQCKDLNISQYVLFTGKLSREDLAKLMGASDIFVMI